MPSKPLKPCTYPGCPALTTGGRCEKHRKQADKAYEATRETATQRGYTWRWHKASKAFLAEHPLCAECKRQGIVAVATVTDHIVPHKGDQDLFWDESNWQGLCDHCHNVKTAAEDGGFGNRGKS